jgi:hypothetical protein
VGCGPNCRCKQREAEQDEGFEWGPAIPEPQNLTIVADQPDGWHACLKQKTRCVIRVLSDPWTLDITSFEATNSCHVEDAEVCPRVTAGSKSGEGYDLCGPPFHAEQEAARLLLETYPDGAPNGGATAFLYGHTWMCQDCQEALVAAGVRHHVITGEEA